IGEEVVESNLVDDGRMKQRKVDLYTLQQAGLISKGQTLHLRDYKGKPVEGGRAEVILNKLVWSGKRYSMSALASKLLMKHGYRAESVRGPAHWYTEDGMSVLDLWRQYRNK